MYTYDENPVLTVQLTGSQFPKFTSKSNPDGWWWTNPNGVPKDQDVEHLVIHDSVPGSPYKQKTKFEDFSGQFLPNTVFIKGNTQTTTSPKTAFDSWPKMYQPWFEYWQRDFSRNIERDRAAPRFKLGVRY
jgi:hypothetical protein